MPHPVAPRRLALAASLFAVVALGAAAVAAAGQARDAAPAAAPPVQPDVVPKPKAFPDAWFIRGDKRPEKLRAMEGTPAPALTTAEWIGESVDLADQRGKVVIVDFWGTWCPPCRKAIPKNIELVKDHADEDFLFVAVHDARRGWNAAPAMIKDTGINYPVARDRLNEAGRGVSTVAYNVAFWPTYIAIDRNGIVRAAGLLPDRVDDVVKILLAEPTAEPKPAPAPAPTDGGGTGGTAG